MEQRLDQIEKMLHAVLDLLEGLASHKAHLTTAQAAKRLGKAEFTIQQYCRQGILKAEKSNALRGPYATWVIPYDEVCRFEREGPRRD
jgi:hypothetical protein